MVETDELLVALAEEELLDSSEAWVDEEVLEEDTHREHVP